MARFGVLILLGSRPALGSPREDCAVFGACCFPTSELRDRAPVSMPRFATIGSITARTVGGGLVRPTVKRVLDGRTAALGACTHGPAELHAHLVIAPSGAAIVGHVGGDPAVATCVISVLRATLFPASLGVTEADLRVTW